MVSFIRMFIGYRQGEVPSAETNVPSPVTPLIYNIHKDEWTDKFVRGSHYSTPEQPQQQGVNAATIGGGVVGGVAVIAVFVFLVIRRRRRQLRKQEETPDTNDSKKHGATTSSSHDHVMPSIENASDAPASEMYLLSKPTQETPISYTKVPMIDAQGNNIATAASSPTWPASPHESITSWPSSTTTFASTPFPPPPPVISPRPISSLNPQEYTQQLQQQIDLHQKYLTIRKNNPQSLPPDNPFASSQMSSIIRGPQGAGEPVHATSIQDLEEQIRSLQAEVSRRQDTQ